MWSANGAFVIKGDPRKQEQRLGFCQDSVTQLTSFYILVSSGDNFRFPCHPQRHLGQWNSKAFKKKKKESGKKQFWSMSSRRFQVFYGKTSSHLGCLKSKSSARPRSNATSSWEASRSRVHGEDSWDPLPTPLLHTHTLCLCAAPISQMGWLWPF